ncbi:MAG: arylesterase [Rhodoferax sp.]
MASLVVGLFNPTQAAASVATQGRLLVLGDSISAEYGLPRGSGWVALLQQRLRQSHPRVEVVNASISGETSAGGRYRLPALLRQHSPRWVLIELGGNDALRGLSLEASAQNLAFMTKAAQDAGARVLLLGMRIPPNFGADYTRRFAQVYEDVARQHKAALLPFLLQPLVEHADLLRWFQADRIHPNEAAQSLILDHVWPSLKPLLS